MELRKVLLYQQARERCRIPDTKAEQRTPEVKHRGCCRCRQNRHPKLYGFGLGFYGPGIYLVALNTLHGWPTSELSSAMTAYYVLGATLLFFWIGPLFDRHGPRKVVVVGTIAMASGVILLALITCPWQVYAAFAVMSVGWATMSGAAINIIVAPWFDRRRGLALGWALNGASAGGIIIAPLLTFLTARFGFALAIVPVAASM